jgi:hypothetical protein
LNVGEKIETTPIAELIQKYGTPSGYGGDFIPFVPDNPDSKTPEKRTFWDVIGEMIAGVLEDAVQPRKDKPADKK